MLVNLGINSITALGRQTVAIMHNPEIRTLCRQLLLDGCRVAQAEGLNFSEQTVDTIMTIYQGYPDEMGTSMYYDIVHQQPLEVEAIQGFIYRRAREHNLDTPYLDTIYSFYARINKICNHIYYKKTLTMHLEPPVPNIAKVFNYINYSASLISSATSL